LFWGGYEISMPMGDLRDFSNKPSFRGFEFGTLWPVFRSLYVGGVFDYHVFSEELGKTTYQIDSGALTANLYRYSRFWSFAGIARYVFLKPDSVFRPFVGVRMGMTFLVNATLVSDLSLYDAPVGFALSPEAGFLAKVAPVMDLSGAIRYDFSTASVDSRKLDNASFLTFQFALVFHPRRP
jgi:outer membrane protein